MKFENIFPVVLMIIDMLAAIIYIINKDFARALYWISAAAITLSTLLIK